MDLQMWAKLMMKCFSFNGVMSIKLNNFGMIGKELPERDLKANSACPYSVKKMKL